jgi:uncharacterized protein YndB with AHSA1/START domain
MNLLTNWLKALNNLSGALDMHKTTLIVEPGKQVVVAATVFDASREKVFELFINPKLIPQWWGPRYLTTKVEKMEVKPGGMWRFIQHDPEGNESGFHGVYHEVIAPKRVTYTFEYEGMPGHILMETVRFEDQGGKTKVTDTSVFQTVEDRDGMLKAGMESGEDESMERLAELLARS